MLLLLAIAFIVVPLVELYVIIQVGETIGALATIAVMLVVSLVGAWLARHEGTSVLGRIRDQLDAGRLPTDELIDGALVLAGGLLLLTPGFVSDAVGILALFPPTRALARMYLRRRFRVVTIAQWGSGPARGPGGPGDVIDV